MAAGVRDAFRCMARHFRCEPLVVESARDLPAVVADRGDLDVIPQSYRASQPEPLDPYPCPRCQPLPGATIASQCSTDSHICTDRASAGDPCRLLHHRGRGSVHLVLAGERDFSHAGVALRPLLRRAARSPPGIGDHCLLWLLADDWTHNRHLLRSLMVDAHDQSGCCRRMGRAHCSDSLGQPTVAAQAAGHASQNSRGKFPDGVFFRGTGPFGDAYHSEPEWGDAALISASGLIMLACTLLSLYLLEALSGRLGRIRGAVTGEPGC